MSSWHLLWTTQVQTANSKTWESWATSRGRKVPSRDSVRSLRRSEGSPAPLLSPTQSLIVMPYLKPFMQSLQSTLPSEPLGFPKCSGEEWTIYIQRASAVFSSSGSTDQFSCFSMPASGNNRPVVKHCRPRVLLLPVFHSRSHQGWLGR